MRTIGDVADVEGYTKSSRLTLAYTAPCIATHRFFLVTHFPVDSSRGSSQGRELNVSIGGHDVGSVKAKSSALKIELVCGCSGITGPLMNREFQVSALPPTTPCGCAKGQSVS